MTSIILCSYSEYFMEFHSIQRAWTQEFLVACCLSHRTILREAHMTLKGLILVQQDLLPNLSYCYFPRLARCPLVWLNFIDMLGCRWESKPSSLSDHYPIEQPRSTASKIARTEISSMTAFERTPWCSNSFQPEYPLRPLWANHFGSRLCWER